jgi:hypothetical protein
MGAGRLARAAGVAGVGVALSGLLGGCEVKRDLAATCHAPGDPGSGQGPGHVGVDLEIPPSVTPGATFTIRVESMFGYPDPAGGPGSSPSGLLAVTGPVTPSGTFPVASFPGDLTFTVTGQPGDQVSLEAVRASSSYLVPPASVLVFECDAHDGHLADIPVVSP